MALDEALLETVSENPTCAVFRTYLWGEPTLSLGYFQRMDDLHADPRWAAVPLVRRPTGGGAIWHDHELTYALIVPRVHSSTRKAADLYASVHEAIKTVLCEHGIAAQRRPGSDAAQGPGRPFLCFQDRAIDDIVINKVKIVGSAQRRRPGAVLQHGSLLLKHSERARELPGLSDLTSNADSAVLWADRLQERVPQALGLSPKPESLTEAEWMRAGVIEQELYRNKKWTERR